MRKIEHRLHNHPKMEQVKKIDDNHVIIDKDVYLALLPKLPLVPVSC